MMIRMIMNDEEDIYEYALLQDYYEGNLLKIN